MAQVKLMLYLIATVLLNYVYGTVQKNCNENSGYYWRDYINEIPSDAIPGGTDENGNPTYIGQTLHPGGPILPGYINVDKQKMFYEFENMEHSSTQDVKILCSLHAEQLQWITTKTGEAVGYLGLIISGHDNSQPLAIGRKIIKSGEMVVGKVIINDKKFESLRLSQDDQELSENDQYEVLVYNSTFSPRYSSEPYQAKCSTSTTNINVYT